MRDAVENVGLLQKQLNELQIENQLLKSLLDRSGISYMQELRHLREPESTENFDPNQGARISHPIEITDKMVDIFLTYCWGRPDVYAKRSEKKNGESGYYPQCNNFWTEICPRKQGQKIKCKDCSYRADKQLTKKEIRAHLEGRSYNASDVVGVYPLFPNGTSDVVVPHHEEHKGINQ